MASAEVNRTANEAVALLQVEVVYSPAAGQVECVALRLPPGSTVRHALQASGLFERHPGLEGAGLALSIWGRKTGPDAPLRERDRVELLRPLTVDPKEARRLRYRGQAAPRKPLPRRG